MWLHLNKCWMWITQVSLRCQFTAPCKNDACAPRLILFKLVSAQHLGRGLLLLATYRACPIWMKCKVESCEWHITRPTCRMNGLFWAGMMKCIPMLFFFVHQRYKQHSAYVISKISWSSSIDKKEKNVTLYRLWIICFYTSLFCVLSGYLSLPSEC